MANSWHDVQGYVVLGHLSNPLWETSADVEIEVKHEVAATMSVGPLVQSGTITSPGHNYRLFGLAAQPFEPEERQITVSDALLTPNIELQIQASRTHLAAAYPQNIWHAGSSQIDVPSTELEFNGGWRRIWNRELLVQRPCVPKDCSWMEIRTIQSPLEQDRKTELNLDTEVHPVVGSLERLTAESLPAAQPVFLQQVQANAQATQVPTHLIGPRLIVEYDLPALQIKS